MMSNGNMPAMPQSGICDSEGNSYDSNDLGGGGLTKREQFAAMAMQGILSNNNLIGEVGSIEIEVADQSLKYADALLSQLEKAK